jgi:hypothetical protein
MEQVPVITSWKDAGNYLQNLKKTVNDDILPLLKAEGSAPFAICREVLSYIDHLGHLYTGQGQQQVGDRSQKFIKQVMTKVDPNYGKRATELYKMFRCGTVHQFAPKVLENKNGELLGWYCYVGIRLDHYDNKNNIKITHLEPIALPANPRKYWLPVSTCCLIDDLMCSIEIFEHSGPENERITAWNRAARDLNIPEAFDFTL